MNGRARLEQLQAQRDALVSALQRDQRLERAGTALQRALQRRAPRGPARTTGDRVAAFGYQLLVVGPLVAMVGAAAGRAVHGEVLAGVALLISGGASVAVSLVPAVGTWLVRRWSASWRLVARAEDLVQRRDEHLTTRGGRGNTV